MSRAEKFISDCTRNCSNYTGVINKKTYEGYYVPWLTPDQAREAVEIAKDEMVEKGIKFLKDHLEGYEIFGSDIERSVESFKLAMMDE